MTWLRHGSSKGGLKGLLCGETLFLLVTVRLGLVAGGESNDTKRTKLTSSFAC